MKHKSFLSVLLCVLLLFQLTACHNPVLEEKKQIAVIVKSEHSAFWQTVQKGVEAAAAAYNVSVTFAGPDNEEDYVTQNQMIEEAARTVDAILLSAIDYEQCAGAVTAAAQQGVKMIAIDSPVHSSAVSMFVGTDNVAAGVSAAKAVLKGLPTDKPATVGILNVEGTTENGRQREEGFRNYMAQFQNIEILPTVHVPSNVGSARQAVNDLLTAHPEICALVGLNEFMTLGIGDTVEALQLSNRLYTVGFDANVRSIEQLEAGDMDALIVQNPFAIGYLGIEYAMRCLEGATTETKLYTQTSCITKETMFTEENQKLLFHFEG